MIGVLFSLTNPTLRAARTQAIGLTAFDTQRSDLCTGTLLLPCVIEYAVLEGIQIDDMPPGNERFKQLPDLERIATRGALSEIVNEPFSCAIPREDANRSFSLLACVNGAKVLQQKSKIAAKHLRCKSRQFVSTPCPPPPCIRWGPQSQRLKVPSGTRPEGLFRRVEDVDP